MMVNLNDISGDILDNLRLNATTIVSGNALLSPRTVGDAVQDYLASKGLIEVLNSFGIDVTTEFGRRSMEDMAFKDSDDNYYAVDVKTHNIDTDFNMPNLISVRRLANFYKNDDRNFFCLLIISYKVSEGKIEYKECHFQPIEAFDWSCLTLGALGWGQIQIANANNIKIVNEQENLRKNWMLRLCDKISVFYDEEIEKISERKSWFKSIRTYWEEK